MRPLELFEYTALAARPSAIQLQSTVPAGRPPSHLPGSGAGEGVGALLLLLRRDQGWKVEFFWFLTTRGGASQQRLLEPIASGVVDGLVELHTHKGEVYALMTNKNEFSNSTDYKQTNKNEL